MENIIVILILFIVAGGAIYYLIRLKKHGETSCIGCPYSNRCGGKCDDMHSSNTSNNRDVQN